MSSLVPCKSGCLDTFFFKPAEFHNLFKEIYEIFISKKIYTNDMKLYDNRVKRFLDNWPGKRYLGLYRFLPIFFVLGAALEFSMINWQVGQTNFYKTYKRRQAKNVLEQKLLEKVQQEGKQ